MCTVAAARSPVVAAVYLIEQEFVGHVFAPIDGPQSGPALDQLATLWSRLQGEMGIDRAIPGVQLPTSFPGPSLTRADRPLAVSEDPRGSHQMILRRNHDVLVLSLVLSSPPSAGHGGSGGPAVPGWAEFGRWWRQLVSGRVSAMLGVVSTFQAITLDGLSPLADWGRAAVDLLPPGDGDTVDWWSGGAKVGPGLAMWDVNGGARIPERRLVVLAGPGGDERLSAFTWRSGRVDLPRLARYLLHAARLRHQADVRGDGSALIDLRARIEETVTRVGAALSEAGDIGPEMTALLADEAILSNTRVDLRLMRDVVAVESANLALALHPPLSTDEQLGRWLAEQLIDDTHMLDATALRAGSLRELVAGAGRWPIPTVHRSPAPSLLREHTVEPGPEVRDRVEIRMGFGFDLVAYSSRSTPLQRDAQRRLADLTDRVLDDIGVRLVETDHQPAGDGQMVVLRSYVELHRALPALLHGWRNHLAEDNKAHDDRLRVRLSVSVGPFTLAAIGYAGATIIEIGRLLNSGPIRSAMTDHPDADVVGLVSDRLYADVVGEGYPDPAPAEFVRRHVVVKSYRKHAWLWVPRLS